MIETIFLATVIPMIYTGVGVCIFRKVYFKVKSEYLADSSRRYKWTNDDSGGLWAAGCMVGTLTWPIAGFFVGMYYAIVSKHTTPWEKEEQLKELQRKNDQMERELGIGRHAPSNSYAIEDEKSQVLSSLMEELDRLNGTQYNVKKKYNYGR